MKTSTRVTTAGLGTVAALLIAAGPAVAAAGCPAPRGCPGDPGAARNAAPITIPVNLVGLAGAGQVTR
ncbi:hypothetical protein AB0G04_41410 [Actinoplanes sp. NPDC023801]|uniref:hypothetical protein n=1 Tax=Actinoplanes sp. NPDC023801 TaxID=3154595 RepID=UPI0033FE56DE